MTPISADGCLRRFFGLCVLCVCVFGAQVSPTPSSGGDLGGDYGETFHGEGTYYTGTDAGNCGYFTDFPEIYGGMTKGKEGET